MFPSSGMVQEFNQIGIVNWFEFLNVGSDFWIYGILFAVNVLNRLVYWITG